MYRRLVLIGSADWLCSSQLRYVCDDRRAVVAGTYDLDTAGAEQWGEHSHLLLVHLGRATDSGFARMASILGGRRRPRWIAVTRSIDEDLIRRCLELDAWGQLLESAGAPAFRETIARVQKGRLSYPPAFLDRIVTRQGRMTLGPSLPSMLGTLHADERVLLKLLVEGLPTAQAARQMGISARTARRYANSLMKKLGVHNLASLVRWAIRARIIEP